MKTFLQHDERDCGAACLAMVADHYGYTQSINVFRELTSTDKDGTSIYGIIQAAKQIGFVSEALFGNMEELEHGIHNQDIKMPIIAHIITDDNYYHYIVVSAINNGIVSVLDPAKGKCTITQNDFIKHWTGNIITFQTTKSFQKRKRVKSGLLGFFSLLKGQSKRFIAIILISSIISVIGIMGAFIFQLIIDHLSEIVNSGLSEHSEHIHDIEYLSDNEWINDALERITNAFEDLNVDSITVIFIGMICLYILSAIIQYVRGKLIIQMSKEIDLKLTLPYFNHIIDLPLPTVLRRKTGDYLSRYSDTSSIRNAISTATLTLILDTLMAAGCAIILYLQNPPLFLIATIIIVIYSCVILINRKRISESNRTFMEKNAGVQSFMKESIDGIETVKSTNSEQQIKDKMSSKFYSFIDAAIKKSSIVVSQDALITGIETVGIAAILWKGFSMVLMGQTSLGSLVTFYILLGYFITPIKNLIELQPVMQSAIVAADRISDILESPIEETKNTDKPLVSPIKQWTISNLSFRYGNGDLLLHNISFSFNQGDKIAIVGKSGSGKTTLAKLFARLYTPENGEILIDGTPLDDYSIRSIRDSIVYVSNNTSLFSGTIYDNLRIGNPNASEEEIQRLCETIGISQMIESLPMGYNFTIEESGTNLSSGQKQRIAIARALLMNPQLLILDEATANIDYEAECELMRAINELNSSITVLVISHKTTTIRNYNRILVIENGSVVGNGTHNDLVQNCPTYSRLIMSP